LLAGMPPPEPAHVIDFPSPPPPAAVPLPLNVAPPTIEPPETPPTLAPAPPTPEPIRIEAPAPRAPSVVEAHSRAEATSSRNIIADAFSALLAAEQGEPGAAPPRLPG